MFTVHQRTICEYAGHIYHRADETLVTKAMVDLMRGKTPKGIPHQDQTTLRTCRINYLECGIETPKRKSAKMLKVY